MTWQPIETAPKGEPVLGWDGEDMLTTAKIQGEYGLGWYVLTFELKPTASPWGEDENWSPTHWQPLPEPPDA